MGKKQVTATQKRAGWRISPWCEAIGISRQSYYNLKIRPRSVKLGDAVIIHESPNEYLERVERVQGAGAQS